MATRDSTIRSAGIVQAVINSQAPPEEWERRAKYGLLLAGALAERLDKNKCPIPKWKKESKNGTS